ncbi:MAG: TolC family protein [Candidatus Hydrogenedentota bacterium]
MNFLFVIPRTGTAILLLVLSMTLAFHPTYAADTPNTKQIDTTGSLSIVDAAALALQGSPMLDAFSFDVRAAEARKLQAGYRPNPELEFEAEDLRWHPTDGGGSSGFSGTKVTIGVSQAFELGGKRSKRIEAGSLDVERSSWDYRTARADVLASVSRNFVHVLIAQEAVGIAQETITLAQRVRDTIAARVEAGQVSPLELNRADLAVSTSTIDHERSRRELLSARARLAAVWGSNDARFERVVGDLNAVRPVPSLADLKHRTSANPDVARWMTEIGFRESIVEVERSNRIPNLNVSAGYRVSGIQEAKDQSAILGFSLPFPLFNRNQGTIQEAKYMVRRATRMRDAAKVNAFSQLTDAYYEVSIAYLEIQSLVRDVLPQAEETFDAINEAYRQGKLGYLDVLESQRTLIDFRIQHLEAIGNYHREITVIDRLIGEPLFQGSALTAEKPREN